MNTLWFVPVVVLLIGTASIAVLVARLGGAVDELQLTLSRMADVRQAVIALRVEAAVTRASLDHLRQR